jgi:hypothetical protein
MTPASTSAVMMLNQHATAHLLTVRTDVVYVITRLFPTASSSPSLLLLPVDV